MTKDGEFFVTFAMDDGTGGRDIYFAHGFPGNFSNLVLVSDDLWTDYHNEASLVLNEKNCYLLWRNYKDPLHYDYNYVNRQAIYIPYNGSPSASYDLEYCSKTSSSHNDLYSNPMNLPLFYTGGSGGAAPGYPSKYLMFTKIVFFSYPNGLYGNIIPMDSYTLPPSEVIVSNSGLIVITISNFGIPSKYNYCQLDYY